VTEPQLRPRYLADGETLSAEQLADTHVPHPGVGTYFQRSTLVVGSKGAGKTFLLRHRKHTTHPGALYINLFKTLNSIARDSGLGGRASGVDPDTTTAIESKTAALLGATAYELAAKEHDGDVYLDLDGLNALLPRPLRQHGVLTHRTVKQLSREIQSTPLREWTEQVHTELLIDAIRELSDASPTDLALFLDRAEDVTTPSVSMLMSLLDQSTGFLVVLAGRPAISQLIPSTHATSSVPNDHFDIKHLGLLPYSDEWLAFAQTATENYLSANDGTTVQWDDGHTWALRLARDSIRLAVSLAQISLDTAGIARINDRRSQVAGIRAGRLASCCAALIPDYRDFRQVLAEIQDQCRDRLAHDEPFCLHAGVEDEAATQLSLLGERTEITDYLLRAIRVDAFCLPSGYQMHPYELPTVFEVNPILAWDAENPKWIS